MANCSPPSLATGSTPPPATIASRSPTGPTAPSTPTSTYWNPNGTPQAAKPPTSPPASTGYSVTGRYPSATSSRSRPVRKPGGWPVTHTPDGPSPSHPSGPGGRCPRRRCTSTWPTDSPPGEPLRRPVNTNTTSTPRPVPHPRRPTSIGEPTHGHARRADGRPGTRRLHQRPPGALRRCTRLHLPGRHHQPARGGGVYLP